MRILILILGFKGLSKNRSQKESEENGNGVNYEPFIIPYNFDFYFHCIIITLTIPITSCL